MSRTASLAQEVWAPVAGADHAELLSAVDAFTTATVKRRIRAHEIPLTSDDIGEIVAAAAEMGLLDPDPEGYGLWAGGTAAGRTFSTDALRTVARASCGAAFELHQAALAGLASVVTSSPPPAPGVVFTPSGRLGIGGAELGRWLGGHELSACDTETLRDLFGSRSRTRICAEPSAEWLAPTFDGDGFSLTRFRGEGQAHEPAHGLDGLWTCRAVAADTEEVAALSRSQLAELLTAHQLGIVAIALGAADTASERALAYAEARRQGGTEIVAHDAIAMMLAGQQAAQLSVAAQLMAAAAASSGRALTAAVALRLPALPALHGAVDAAVQIHGGSGYMRDTGVEHLLRDTGSLRVLGGAPDDLRLLFAALLTPAAGCHEPPATSDCIAGHAPAASPLSPQPGFRSKPILRMMSSYRALEPWDRDTRDLPRPLREYRRQIRAFATEQLEPLAAGLDLAMLSDHGPRPELQELLATAGRAGLLSDLLPQPAGSVPPHRYRTPLVLQQALRTEELARADGGLMLYLSAHNLGLSPVLFSGNRHAYREVALPALRACRAGDPQIFAFAITEPGAGSDAEDGHGAALSSPGLVASRVAGGWTLKGSKLFISGGDIARWVVAFAAIEDEGFDSWTAFLVDTRSGGFSRLRTEHKMGMRASGAAAIAFDDCFVPDELVLGGLRGGWALNRATLNFSRLPVAGMSVGFAQRATEIATDFACRERVAGRPLIDRQHAQLAIADMQAETSAIRSLVWQFARRRVPEQAKASIAKFHAGDRAQVVIERAMGLLGEHGLAHSTELERVFRDNRLTRIFEGTNQINRLAVIEDQQELLLARVRRAP